MLRAPQWLHFAALPLAGLDRAAIGSIEGLGRGALASAAASLALGYAYGVNALADRASDRSVEKNPLAGVERVPTVAHAVVAGAAAAAFAASLPLGARASLLTLASLAAGTAYSVGPRMKALPVLGLAFNTAIFTPLLGLALPSGAPPPAYAALFATFVGQLVQSQLLHEIADAAEDEAAEALTTARLLGPRWARACIAGTALVSAAAALALAPRPVVGLCAAAGLACSAAAALSKLDPAEARRIHKHVAAAGGALLFAVGLFS
ncbi:UbiA family prenyltransferase [Polyangium aurulentum]|uniref:UbiA family prenyltransferase n=1 Tax=Polyangium aurulentum TaxID=2567896 RepID=UPI00200CEA31|nr:UbiA family prenyltransferase [Polyangium aurulentum]UQA60136.1 UbiA family prenyltransferase [Polyangium aurulentum]